MIPIAKPIIEEDEIEEVVAVLKTGMIAQGPKVAEFEEKFADYIGVDYAVAVNSGTAALHVALLSAGIGPGDEVITTPFTFAATGNSVLYTGARPVFVDICPDTFNINPELIEEAISDKTKAILPVQLYGQSADMNSINKIAKAHDLIVIEDAAQAHGAELDGKRVGSLGDMGCFSFYPTKNMTTGEGGIITTNSDRLADSCRVYRAHGSHSKYSHTELGYNFRMTDIGAAIGVAQLRKIEDFNRRRNSNAEYLTEAIKDIGGIQAPFKADNARHVYHQYTIRVDGSSRDDFVGFLNDNGIGTGVHYPIPLYNQDLYKKLGYDMVCEEADKAAASVISLPVHPSLTDSDLDEIIKVLKQGSEEILG